MKALSVRLPDRLMAEIETASRKRNMSKSAVVHERLQLTPRSRYSRAR
jgi:hypothetical protein